VSIPGASGAVLPASELPASKLPASVTSASVLRAYVSCLVRRSAGIAARGGG